MPQPPSNVFCGGMHVIMLFALQAELKGKTGLVPKNFLETPTPVSVCVWHVLFAVLLFVSMGTVC